MKQDPKHIRISDFNYPLPDERIAKFPLPVRDHSKLLVYRRGRVCEDVFTSLPDYIEPGELMVFNNTKVIQARLHFRKETGALIEVFCLEPVEPGGYAQSFRQTGHCAWLCLVGNLKKWKEGSLRREMAVKGHLLTLTATRGGNRGAAHRVDFCWDDPGITFADILEVFGELPIPPYLNRATQESDKEAYQTVYSKVRGSVAAPTAGLHFTPRVLDALRAKGVDMEELTLHVGAGTFRPVKSEEMRGHEMHTEHIAVPRATIEKLLAHGGKAIAVGTTSVRTLESLYHIGLTLLGNPDATEEELRVSQWQPYGVAGAAPTSVEALQALLGYLDRHGLDALHTGTQIIIVPGYDYKVVKAMVTNFHQPQSTLLLLVSAFVHGDWRTIYDYALAHDFRFLSYGDSSLLMPEAAPKDNDRELFPLVDEEGNLIGSATRGECHNGSKLLHPVVHLHVFDSQGRLYLQRRPAWKDIQPGKWDTSVGGHVDLGESVEQALRREAREELGIAGFTPRPVARYVFESARERELVFSFRTVYDGPIVPSDELDGGRFWSVDEIRAALGKGVFTPNFEGEVERVLG